MPSYKLTYFDFDGGRGEPIRVALHAAGIEFEDERWTFPVFQERRGEARFSALPVMEIDGIAVTQKRMRGYPMGVFAAINDDRSTVVIGIDKMMKAISENEGK